MPFRYPDASRGETFKSLVQSSDIEAADYDACFGQAAVRRDNRSHVKIFGFKEVPVGTHFLEILDYVQEQCKARCRMWKVIIHEDHFFKNAGTGAFSTIEHRFSTREKAIAFLETEQGLVQDDETTWRRTFDGAESKARLNLEEEVEFLNVRGEITHAGKA